MGKPGMTAEPRHLTAIIVLYKKLLGESEAFTSLQALLSSDLAIATRFRVIVYDHSPIAVAFPKKDESPVALSYVHDASNQGLATAFNYALAKARANASEWLLLLDQDTTLTRDYLMSLLEAIDEHQASPNIGAFVPLLEFEGSIYSPEETFFYHLRHQFRHIRYYRCSADTEGLQTRALNAYNSGAALRVSAMTKIGGFPKDFPLDYLDFAFFHLLHAHGYSLYVIGQQLHQELSHGDLNDVSFTRHTSVMQSQARFVSLYGTWLDQLLFRLWLARMSRRYKESCRDPRVWKNMLRQSLGLPLLRDHQESA